MERCLCSACGSLHVGDLMICCPHKPQGDPETKSMGPALSSNKGKPRMMSCFLRMVTAKEVCLE